MQTQNKALENVGKQIQANVNADKLQLQGDIIGPSFA